MAGTIEDKRAAANATVSLSSFLITASLGVIAAQAVIVTFVLDKRQGLFWFTISAGAGLIASLASIYCGGRGITDLLKRGFEGDWDWKTKSGHFNGQAILALVGILAVALSLFCGTPKSENPVSPPTPYALKSELREVQSKLDDLTTKYESLSTRVSATAEISHCKRTKK